MSKTQSNLTTWTAVEFGPHVIMSGNLGGHPYRQNLSGLMEFGHVIRVNEDGTVTDGFDFIHVPESAYLQLDEDGQSMDDDFVDLPEGWEPLTGYTGQHGYSGPVMHSSEFIGGRMARDILEEPGYYVAVAVDGLSASDDDEDQDNNIGWAVFRHDGEPS